MVKYIPFQPGSMSDTNAMAGKLFQSIAFKGMILTRCGYGYYSVWNSTIHQILNEIVR